METPQITYQDLYDIRERFFDDGHFDIMNEAVQFRDILTQEPVLPRAIPDSVQNQLAEGFDQLKCMGSSDRLYVQLVLGSHGSAADFQAITDRHGPLLERAQNIGIEASWQLRDAAADRETILPQDVRAVAIGTEQAPGRHQFQMAQLQWLWGHDKTILPCQPEVGGVPTALESAMEQMWGIYDQAAADITITPEARTAAQVISHGIYQTHRHWMLLGQFGVWLKHLDAQGKLDDKRNHVPLMLGRWHALSVHRLAQLGVMAEEYQAPANPALDTPEYQRYGQMVMGVILGASASMGVLCIKTPG